MSNDEYISISETCKLTQKSNSTIRRLISKLNKTQPAYAKEIFKKTTSPPIKYLFNKKKVLNHFGMSFEHEQVNLNNSPVVSRSSNKNEQRNEQRNEHITTSQDELIKSLNDRIDELKEQIESLKNDKAELKEDKSNLEKRVIQLEQLIDDYRKPVIIKESMPSKLFNFAKKKLKL